MKKEKRILIPLLAISVVFILGYRGFGLNHSLRSKGVVDIVNTITNSTNKSPIRDEAWTTFQSYLEYAHTHNLSGVRSLSHQISPTCNDPAKEAECFALMDSVYAFSSAYQKSDFNNALGDKRQVVMYTEGPMVTLLYLTRNDEGALKVLGMRFCIEDENDPKSCVDIDKIVLDENKDGWWDSVESLFYK